MSYSRRSLLLFGGQLGFAGVLGARMYQLQVLEAEKFQGLADENRINIKLLPPVRGQIFDRNGALLAKNEQNYRVTIVREQVPDIENTMQRLQGILKLSESDIAKILKELKRKSPFVPVTVAENLNWFEFAQINANAPALPGIFPEVGWKRYYPQRDTFAHIIGYVRKVDKKDIAADRENNPLLKLPDFKIGKIGVEKALEKELRGSAGTSHIEVNAVGRMIRELDRDTGKTGADLNLTISLDLQKYAMDRLAGQSAAAVVMDVNNGDVLALASAPGYDPNDFVVRLSNKVWEGYRDDPLRPLSDKTATGLYPPGSTFKMVVALAALEHGIVDRRYSVFCNGKTTLGKQDFHCWRRHGHGKMNLKDALKHSCDIYFYDIAKKVGIDKIAEVANRLGIGVTPQIELTNVKKGLMPTIAWKEAIRDKPWVQGDTLNAGIGQGFVLTSPLQLAVMTARLANKKHMVEPRLIKKIDNQPAHDNTFGTMNFNQKNLDYVLDGMNAVMNEKGGTSFKNRIIAPGMEMAGKTGTAQVRRISKKERQTYVRKNEELPWKFRDHALFVCYAPVDKPKYACAVIIEHGGSGSKAAAPVARDIMLRALYDGKPPLSAYPEKIRDDIVKQEKELEERRRAKERST